MNLKKTLLIPLALIVFSITFLVENAFSRGQTPLPDPQIVLRVPVNQEVKVTRKQQQQTVRGKKEFILEQGDVLETQSAPDTEIRFSHSGAVRLEAQSTLSILLHDQQADGYLLSLVKGRMWVNNLYSSSLLNIMAGSAYLIPQRSIFDVNVNSEKTLVYAHQHSLTIGLIPKDFLAERIVSVPAANFINSYLLPQKSQTTVYPRKIAEQAPTLQKLLYSKLVKEFPVSLIDAEQLQNDPWLKKNTQADNKLLTEVSTNMLRFIRDRGLKIAQVNSLFYELNQALTRFGNTLTFSDEKVTGKLLESIFKHFHDSQYLFVFGRLNEGTERLSFFTHLLQESFQNNNQSFRKKLLSSLWREYQAMSFVEADEPLYSAKNALMTTLFTQVIADKYRMFLLLRDIMNNVYDLAEKNPTVSRQALDEYFQHFNTIVTDAKLSSEDLKNFLVSENQVMNNLLKLYPGFYRDRVFALKNDMEQQWLKLVPDGNDKNEAKQTVIGNKIDFLRQLKDFFLQDQIPLDETRRIIFRLFREAENLQLPQETAVAVSELYAKRLEDFGIFFRFLNSPEYVFTSGRGASRQEQFDRFLAVQKKPANPVQFLDLSREIKETALESRKP